jgi:hypothetical protein
MTIIIASPIHKGHNTQNQDHVITLHSFNVMKTIANKPVNPIPLLFDELFDIILIFKG